MQMFQQCSERSSFRHLGESVDILGEALATIAILAIEARNIGVGVVDVARKQNTRMHFAPVSTHLLAVFAAGVEVGDLVGSEHVVHILGKLSFQRSHDGEFLAHKNLG